MKYKLLPLKTFQDARGDLTPLEFRDLPFTPRRVYFLTNIKKHRGGHAHLKEQEIFLCLKGSLRAKIHDGKRWRIFRLKTKGPALYNNKMCWHQFDQFSKGAILLAISSTPYNGDKKYIFNFQEFMRTRP